MMPSPEESSRSAWMRKGFHAFNATWGVMLYHFLVPRWMAVIVVGALTAILGGIEILRMRIPCIREQFEKHWLFGPMLRTGEAGRLSGAFWFGLGVTLSLALFPRPVVEAACLAMGFGDAAAALVGRRYGTVRIGANRTLQGSLAFFAVTLGVVAAFRGVFYGGPWTSVLLWGAVTGLAGAVVELASWRLDDNLTVPVLTSAALLLVM